MSFWQSNLAFLASRPDPWSPALAALLATEGPAPDLGLRSRTGEILPGVVVDGRARSLISSFDARREADRWAQGGGTVVVLGGAGVDAALALAEQATRLMLWAEPRLEIWRSLMTWQDWTVVKDCEWLPALDVAEVLTNRYHPLWDGGLRTLEWRAASDGLNGLLEAITAALESVSTDASTQARFAERWYRNTLINLRDLNAGAVEGFGSAVVAGAGPSLDDALASGPNLAWLEQRQRHGGRLLATDTALPALSARGIRPDLVFSLDSQLATYRHFVAARPAVPLVADIASLPVLGRLGMPLVRFLTAHPFSAVVQRYFPEIPTLSAPGGHVSALAYSAALALGARSLDTWGVDFSYRDGQAYARATYVYDTVLPGRVSPLETLLGALCYGAEGRVRQMVHGRAIDTTPRLAGYRRHWPPLSQGRVVLAHGAAGDRWPAFARDWRRRLETLPLPPDGANMHGFVRSLTADVRQDWLALWPLALALFRIGTDSPRDVVGRALELLYD